MQGWGFTFAELSCLRYIRHQLSFWMAHAGGYAGLQRINFEQYFYKLETNLESFAYTSERANILATRNPLDVCIEVGCCGEGSTL